MTKRLYKVEISDVAYVVAESEKEAEKIAKRSTAKFDLDYDARAMVDTYLDGVWNKYDVPYGDDEMHSLEYWLEKGKTK